VKTLLATVIDWTALGETVLAALVAGTVVTLFFSIGIYGATRFADLRRDGRPIEAALLGLLAAACGSGRSSSPEEGGTPDTTGAVTSEGFGTLASPCGPAAEGTTNVDPGEQGVTADSVTIGYGDFKVLLTERLVQDLEISTDTIDGKLTDKALDRLVALRGEKDEKAVQRLKEVKVFTTVRMEDSDLVKELGEKGVRYTVRPQATWFMTLLSWVLPILLFFDRDECPYCEQALREYLVPFSREEWKGKAVFRQVGIDRRDPVVDFAGVRTTHQALAERYGVFLSPTVLIVDAKGNRLAEPIVGLLTVDFYGAYIDNALKAARGRLAG